MSKAKEVDMFTAQADYHIGTRFSTWISNFSTVKAQLTIGNALVKIIFLTHCLQKFTNTGGYPRISQASQSIYTVLTVSLL